MNAPMSMNWFRGHAKLFAITAISGAACSVTSASGDGQSGGNGGQANSAGAPASGSGASAASSSGGAESTTGGTDAGGNAGDTGMSAGAGDSSEVGPGGTGNRGPHTGGNAGDDTGGAAGTAAGNALSCGNEGPEVPQTGTAVQSDSGAPSIEKVYVSRIGQDIHIEVDGDGFGTAPHTLPAVGYLPQFSITDITQGGWSAGGPNQPVYLQYTSWTDSRIVIDGFGTQYGGQYEMSVGDEVSIFVQSTKSGGLSTTWNGTLKSEPPPRSTRTGRPRKFVP